MASIQSSPNRIARRLVKFYLSLPLGSHFSLTIDPSQYFSMYPFFEAGDILNLHKDQLTSISVGDIIAFYEPTLKEVVVHRVIKINLQSQISFITRGDSNQFNDRGRVTSHGFLGKVESVMSGRKLITLSHPAYRLIGLTLPLQAPKILYIFTNRIKLGLKKLIRLLV